MFSSKHFFYKNSESRFCLQQRKLISHCLYLAVHFEVDAGSGIPQCIKTKLLDLCSNRVNEVEIQLSVNIFCIVGHLLKVPF